MFDRARVSSSREPRYLRIYPQSTVFRKVYLKNFLKITFLIPSKEVILENVNLYFLQAFQSISCPHMYVSHPLILESSEVRAVSQWEGKYLEFTWSFV